MKTQDHKSKQPKGKKAVPFALGKKGSGRLNANMQAVRKSLITICELKTHDLNPSIKQEDFEELYIDKAFAPLVTILSADTKALMDALAKQREKLAEKQKAEKGKKEQSK